MVNRSRSVSAWAIGLGLIFVSHAQALQFDVPRGDLNAALTSYMKQAGISLMYVPAAVRGISSEGVRGNLAPDAALSRILVGTGFKPKRTPSGAISISRDDVSDATSLSAVQLAAAPATTISGAALETVTVTSSKIGGDVQNIPISITALSQEQLTATQTAGGPDLVKQVPNMTFTKTNFSGYNIQIRGIGTQAISVTTDPAVAVAFNDIPFIRNHFFEQEFYDVSQVEVLRGPQGTLYGRNATAGVVNLISAKPTDQFEAMASADIGNYQNRRFEGMINIPIVDDRRRSARRRRMDQAQRLYAQTRLWTRPSMAAICGPGRVTLGLKPTDEFAGRSRLGAFQRRRRPSASGKQLCETSQSADIDQWRAGAAVGQST